MYYCCVPGCPGTAAMYKMHRFPKDPERYEVWLQLVGNQTLFCKTAEQVRKTYRVCDQHFSTQAKIADGKGWRGSNLMADAVPSLGLGLQGNPTLHGKTIKQVRQSYRVCDRHFDIDSRIPDGKGTVRRSNLRVDAIPSLYLPHQAPGSLPPPPPPPPSVPAPPAVVLIPMFLKKNSQRSAPNPEFSEITMGVPLTEVLSKLQEIAPLKLAESWDNVGLLVQPEKNSIIKNVLLTIDLTEDVVDEALESEAGLIISYHPNIFRPIKTVTQSHWKERIITKCIKNDIAVFSPHTSWDAIKDGVNDWLCSIFKSKNSRPILPNPETSTIGMGRLLELESPITLNKAVEDVKQHLGLSHVRVGVGRHKHPDTDLISTIAVCAGSGGSVFSGIQADLYLTGEMMHHDVLEATQKGISVILCNHSDSERGYLKFFQRRFKLNGLNIIVSKVDKDCLKII